jgi:hypothetical protein
VRRARARTAPPPSPSRARSSPTCRGPRASTTAPC